MFQSLLIVYYSETKCHLKINVPLYVALLSHPFYNDRDMELRYKPHSRWVTTGNTAHAQGVKTWSRAGGVGKTISFREIWQLEQTGMVSLSPIPTAVSHWAGMPVGCSPHPSSLCQAQFVPATGNARRGYWTKVCLCSWGCEKRSLLDGNDNSFFFFFPPQPNHLFE